MTARAFLGLSHSPLMGLNDIAPAAQAMLQNALDEMRDRVLAFAPELIVLVAPDHYNGFFNELMPPFCIGTQARSVGDYLSPAGELNVDAVAALALGTQLMNDDFDLALSRAMVVDHGFAQSLQLIWGGLETPPLVPIFLNAIAQPGVPRLRRCRALGQAIGRFLRAEPRRTLLLGSGGLSHEPPVPTMSSADPALRAAITHKKEPSQAERDAKTARVMAAGRTLASGSSSMKPINPRWDRLWMDAIAADEAALDALCSMNEADIEREAGIAAHESKTWLVGRSALPTDRRLICLQRHYQAVPEYIAGFGVMLLTLTP